KNWFQGETRETQLTYWKAKLTGEPTPLELPTDRPRPAHLAFRGGLCSRTLPASLSNELRALGRNESATLYMTILAAFNALLHRYTGQEDIWVGTPISNRSRQEVEGLIGLFINTLVLRADLSGNPSFRELLQRIRKLTLEA